MCSGNNVVTLPTPSIYPSTITLPLLPARIFFFFFFQAEDGIRDVAVTGVRRVLFRSDLRGHPTGEPGGHGGLRGQRRGDDTDQREDERDVLHRARAPRAVTATTLFRRPKPSRSEERRVGKERGSRSVKGASRGHCRGT